MPTLTVPTLIAVLVLAFVAGFGWSAGCWLWAMLTRPRRST